MGRRLLVALARRPNSVARLADPVDLALDVTDDLVALDQDPEVVVERRRPDVETVSELADGPGAVVFGGQGGQDRLAVRVIGVGDALGVVAASATRGSTQAKLDRGRRRRLRQRAPRRPLRSR
jgi:hypothetical protein